MSKKNEVPCLILQNSPPIYTAIILGRWLLKHSTPVWRLKDPEKGFQRIVRQERAEQMAAAVLDKQRAFPNAIILATDKKELLYSENALELDGKLRFLVVDGQHRLWAQKYSTYEAKYVCVIHCNLDEVKMAKLFLEINDNQKRVPASLRWDLVRLVRPDDDRSAIAAVDLVYELTNNEESPLYQRVDLTGEVPDKTLNQGSLAPELKSIVTKRGVFRDADFKTQTQVLIIYLATIRSLDPSGWKTGKTPFYKARVMRVLIRLLPEILAYQEIKDLTRVESTDFLKHLEKINKDSLSDDEIRAKQGSAGMKAIQDEIRNQIF
jgi:DGQHR domain-containing protein